MSEIKKLSRKAANTSALANRSADSLFTTPKPAKTLRDAAKGLKKVEKLLMEAAILETKGE